MPKLRKQSYTQRKLSIRNANREARSDAQCRFEEQLANTSAHREARLDPVRREMEQLANTSARKELRKDPARREMEQLADKSARKEVRKDPTRRKMEQFANTSARNEVRKDPARREMEQLANTSARKELREDPARRKMEQLADKSARKEVRKNPNRRKMEQFANTSARKEVRKDPARREMEQLVDKSARKEVRKDPARRKMEQFANTSARKEVRKDPARREMEQLANTSARKELREDPSRREMEQLADKSARKEVRKDPVRRKKEQSVNSRARRELRKDLTSREIEQRKNTIKRRNKRANSNERELEHIKRIKRNESKLSEYDKLVKLYMNEIKCSPSYICSCCGGLFYETSTTKTSSEKLTSRGCSQDIIDTVLHVDQELHRLCSTCKISVYKNRVPRLCLKNGFDFPVIPEELKNLSPLEERLVAIRLPFMQIRLMGCERQSVLRGNVVNVENDLNICASVLPRKFDESSTIQVKLMRRSTYKIPYMYEIIRPLKVYQAAKYLMTTDSYISENVILSEDWSRYQDEETLNFECVNPTSVVCEHEQTNSNVDDESGDEDNDNCLEELDLLDQSDLVQNHGADETLIFSEKETCTDFLGIKIAPAEHSYPIALHRDVNAEVLSFPTIYAGKLRKFKDGVTYTDIAKSELRRYDRRACLPSHILYAFKRSYNEKVVQAIQVCLRKTTRNQQLTANTARSLESLRNLLECDDGYTVFKHLRSSPSYWKEKSKKVMAMIRQLGKPSFFITLSAAETKWKELLIMLHKIVKKTDISEEDLSDLPFEELAELIRSDPVTCMRHFDHRLRALSKHILKKKNGVFSPYELEDQFTRLEFQMRGSPHSHGLYWIKNAPTFNEDDDDSIRHCVQFIDEFITSERCEDGLMAEIIGYQIHKHSHTCKKRSKQCRFGFPKPPLDVTRILTPLSKDVDASIKKNAEDNYKKIKSVLDKIPRNFPEVVEFGIFLEDLDLSYIDYILALRSSIKRVTVFLKRSTNAVYVNAYNRKLLEAWGANIDMQFIVDTYACAKYCVGYILKGEGGVSKLLQVLTQKVKKGRLNAREQLSQFAKVLINGSEISAQEAAAFLLGIPNTSCSRQDVFINTAPPGERVSMLKPQKELLELAADCQDVCCKGLIDHYACRPEELEDICLAEFASTFEYSKSVETRTSKLEDGNARSDKTNVEEDIPASETEKRKRVRFQLLDGSGTVRKRGVYKVIRYRHYGKNEDLDNYCREQLMLFVPWRDEDAELLTVDAIKRFNHHYAVIIENSKPFIHNRDIDDRILSALLNEVDLEEFNDDDSSPLIDDDLEMITDEQNENITSDDLFSKSSKIQSFLPPKLIDLENYNTLMRNLNDKQRRFVLHNLHLLKTNQMPFYTFLSGGAGVGKSHVITATVQSFMRYCLKFPSTNPEQLCVLVSAPTGKAAFNVFGMTLHSTFKLPPSQYGGRLCDLEEGAVNSLRVKLEKTKLFIIDEISMVSVRQLYDIDQRLRQIFGTTEDFGGKSVLVVGHLRQLAPICGSFVFKPPRHIPLGELVGNNLWLKFGLYELDEIMRQKGDLKFCKALNNMSEGVMDEEDISLIKTREVSENLQPPQNAIRLFQTNAECEEYNQLVHSILEGEGAMATAYDVIEGSGEKYKKEALKLLAKTFDRQQNDGLPYETYLKVGGEYFVSTNVDVEDGLFNGSTGGLKKIDYGLTNTDVRVPLIAWMDFRNPLIGIETKKIRKGSNTEWVPIGHVKRNLSKTNRHGGLQIWRKQIPLIACNGMTIAKSQGSSMVNIVVKVISQAKGKRERKLTRENLYVACSRVTSLNGLFIDGKFEPPAKPPSNDAVSLEMERLRSISFNFSIKFLQDYDETWEKLYFHNVEGFVLHLQDVIADPCCMASNMIMFVEPHLLQTDLFNVSNFECISRINCSNNRNSEGALIFKKLHVQYLSTPSFTQHFCDKSHCIIVSMFVSGVNCIMVYKSPGFPVSSFTKHLIDVLNQRNEDVLVFGDINIDLQKHEGKIILELFEKYKLTSLIDIQSATTDGGSHIDCCFSNSLKIKAWIYESYYSYHKPICIIWPKD